MITKGYLLNESRDKNLKYVLAVSENIQELENKIQELKTTNEEKKKRFIAVSRIQEDYFVNYCKIVCHEDRHYYYKIKEFVTNNPIPDEIKEFVKYSEDRNTGDLYFYSMRDFEVRYWITNILGFK